MSALAELLLKFHKSCHDGADRDGDVEISEERWAQWVAVARFEIGPAPKSYQLGIIACSAAKADRPLPARELYTGDLFKKSLKVAELLCERVVVLSARHGVVDPDAVIEPYDWKLPTKAAELKRWARDVSEQLPHATNVLCLAPESYWGALTSLRVNLAERWDTPLKGLGIGQQKARLLEMAREAA